MVDLQKYLANLSVLKIANDALVGEKRVSILKAKGRILGENIVCKIPIPRFDNSAMDGYALRFERGTTPYKNYTIKGSIFAGDSREYILQKNDTFSIMTGAKVPKNCDFVIQKEKVEIRGNSVILKESPKKNQCIKFSGEDFKKGEILLKKGTLLDSSAIGILATQGISKVAVKKRVKIIIFGSGNEITPLNSPLKNNQIYDINSHFIRANFENLNCKITYGGILSDSPKTLRSALKNATKKYHIIITSGGVSVGEKDYIHGILRDLGAEILADGINIKPGRPVVLSTLQNSFILSLPGNPIGAFLQSYFALPILVAKFSGVKFSDFDSLLESRKVANGADFKSTNGTAHIMLGSIKDDTFFAFNDGKYQGAQVAPLLKSGVFVICDSAESVRDSSVASLPQNDNFGGKFAESKSILIEKGQILRAFPINPKFTT